ncbi:unnamed protein product [Microthlaspi erraticum]|uniref:DUF4220 domain-containing protein n=1 Tax=Microthlaspi erraticum TaxID=1685480 RepID=A0A6D2KUC4_9BRAS|nr:unnamed protein product [Microthlaspi erraticum]
MSFPLFMAILDLVVGARCPPNVRVLLSLSILYSLSRAYSIALKIVSGEIVSRSKPFQEREYGEDIKSSSTKEHGTKSHEEERMKLRRAKETSELSSVQMEAVIKHPSSRNTWRSYSTHPELATKNNQPKRSSYEADIEDTFWQIFNGLDGDTRCSNPGVRWGDLTNGLHGEELEVK